MPSETFYRLPLEKKKRIMKSIMEEVSSVSYEAISINRIVKGAGIPRGSFYQYFADKDDMFAYVMQDYKEQLVLFFKECLEKEKGNIFGCYIRLLDPIVGYVSNEQKNKFLKNMLSQAKAIECFLMDEEPKSVMEELAAYFVEYGDFSKMQIAQKDYPIMFEMLTNALGMVIRDSFLHFNDEEHLKGARYKYKRAIEIIEKGCCE